MARYYNHNVDSELPELFSGMKVLVQRFDDQSWEPAIIKEKRSEPRSYIVELSNGSKVRRNRRFLKEIRPLNTTYEIICFIPLTDNMFIRRNSFLLLKGGCYKIMNIKYDNYMYDNLLFKMCCCCCPPAAFVIKAM